MALILTGLSVGWYFFNKLYYTETPKIVQESDVLFRDFKKIANTNLKEVDSFTILQMNVLAKGLCFEGDFKGIDCNPLDFEDRFQKLIFVILQSKPDLFCLEEVDEFDRFAAVFEKEGFGGFFQVKNNRKYPEPQDGTAIFYKKDKFELLEKKSFPLGEGITQNVLIGKFKTKNQNELYVCGTHLKAKPDFAKERETQGQIMMKHIKELNKDNLPVIICGDFNDEPDSLVYKVVKNENYTSSYSFYYDSKVEPYTTAKMRKHEIVHCIDYIWFNSPNLYVKKLLEIPNLKQAFPHLLPSSKYPSDHLSLAVEFGLLKQ